MSVASAPYLLGVVGTAGKVEKIIGDALLAEHGNLVVLGLVKAGASLIRTTLNQIIKRTEDSVLCSQNRIP